MIYSAKLLAASSRSLKGELIMAAVVQEEPCEGMAMRAIVEEGGLWPSFVILGEPSDLQVAVGQRGRIELRVVTQGQACHASTPELGDNALVAASKVIFGVELLASQLGEDPVLGKGSIAVTGIRCSADSHNVVPDRCELIIDRRLTMGETRERALAEVRQIMERERVKGVVTVADYEHTTYTGHVSRGQEFYPTWLMAYDAPLVKTVARSLEKALGSRPRLKVWRFSTDGTYTRGIAGIPTVGFGPGEERLAHTANEHVRVADVLAAVDGYAQIGRDLLGRR
jgi:putative selenium metabolism hydrolase